MLRCYVVDDETHNVHICEYNIVETKGLILVGSETDPCKALEAIKLIKPDIVFTDINMPKLSGIELAKQIDDFTEVIFVSGELKQSLANTCWSNHIFLPKPLSHKRFLEAVELVRKKLDSDF